MSFKVNVKSYVNCTFRNPKAPVPASTIEPPVFERNIEQWFSTLYEIAWLLISHKYIFACWVSYLYAFSSSRIVFGLFKIKNQKCYTVYRKQEMISFDNIKFFSIFIPVKNRS